MMGGLTVLSAIGENGDTASLDFHGQEFA